MRSKNFLQVFEFDKLRLSDKTISAKQLKVLQNHFGEKGVPYYSLIHNGIRFNNHVGVLQIGKLTIEILPKIDQVDKSKMAWRKSLIELLHYTGEIKVAATEFSNLKMNELSLLELYFSLFVKECEFLIHTGLIKKYRKKEGNLNALKGALDFSKNINHNIIHAERFYTRHTIYDKQHLLHQVLQEAMVVVKRVTTSSNIYSSISKLILEFPEQERLNVSANTFTQIHINRKSEPYRKAINIAKMILLNFHPDISKGENSVLALFFDMNVLWEKYVARVMKKHLHNDYQIKTQNKRLFWSSHVVRNANIKPDIVVYKDNEVQRVIDTKWKLPNDNRPSDDDLKQMFSYNKIFNSSESWLLYPNKKTLRKEGLFNDNHGGCGMLLTPILEENKLNHKALAKRLFIQLDLQYKDA